MRHGGAGWKVMTTVILLKHAMRKDSHMGAITIAVAARLRHSAHSDQAINLGVQHLQLRVARVRPRMRGSERLEWGGI